MSDNDRRVLIDRQRRIEDRIDRAESSPPDASAAMLCRTIEHETYPTSAGVAYAVVEVEASGDEEEGSTPTFTPSDDEDYFLAINLGTQVPPVGTVVICRLVGGKWCFRYDG